MRDPLGRRRRHFEIAANLPREVLVQLAMPWNRRRLLSAPVHEDGVSATLTE